MVDARSALFDIRRVMIWSKLFDTFFNTVILFSIATLFLIIFKAQWWLAFLPALGYALFGVYQTFRKTRYQEIEDRVPDLRWQLRTMADNMQRSDEMVESLKRSVLERLKTVGSSYFFDPKRTTYKAMGIFCVAFLIVLVGVLHVQFVEFIHVNPDISEKINNFGDVLSDKLSFTGAFEKKTGREIYGKESVIPLGNEQLDLKITPGQDKADISDVNDVQNLQFNQQGQLQDIAPAGGLSYGNEKNVKGEEANIIKNYFQKINDQGHA